MKFAILMLFEQCELVVLQASSIFNKTKNRRFALKTHWRDSGIYAMMEYYFHFMTLQFNEENCLAKSLVKMLL